MKSKEEEYKELFLAESSENFEELNRYFVRLEKNHKDNEAVGAIFRITHTLKANAAAMGFEDIATLAHLLEDIFSAVKTGKMTFTTDIFNDLFRANDKIGEMLEGIKTGKKIFYKGLLTKLKVILREATENPDTEAAESAEKKTEAQETSEPLENTENQEVEPNDSPADSNEESAKKITFSDVVQVPVSKLDNLLNLVSELAIEKDRIITAAERDGNRLSNEYAHLYRITSDLQYSVMSVRLVQVSLLFHKFHRIVRDVAGFEQKKVRLEFSGTEIEIDRNILQIISDSLIHLVRNAVSHGIETPAKRLAAGKNEEGVIRLAAKNDQEYVVIEVIDDGGGINPEIIRKKVIEKGMLSAEAARTVPDQEIINYIFEAGFSSSDSVTAVSGRGVGMDVVRKAIDSIGGKVEISTRLGKGSVFSLSLPTSMAVKSVLLFESGDTEYAIPLGFTDSVIQIGKKDIHKVAQGLATVYDKKTISIVFLKDLFADPSEIADEKHRLQRTYDLMDESEMLHIMIVKLGERQAGFVVDKLLQQKEIIEKPLKRPADKVPFISGATILGNGNVCLVMDIPSVMGYLYAGKTVGKLNILAQNEAKPEA